MVEEYTLRQEKERFAGFLDRLTERLDKLGPRLTGTGWIEKI